MKYLFIVFLLIPFYAHAKECEQLIAMRVDKSFSIKQKDLIEKAARVWYKASNKRICFYIAEVDLSMPEDYRNDGMISVYSGNYKWQHNVPYSYQKHGCLAVTMPGVKFKHDIFVLKNKKFFELMIHEIGHLIGFHHTKYGVMYKYITKGNIEPSIKEKKILKCILDKNQLGNWRNGCQEK